MSGDDAVRVWITGRVQGVWYRGWTVDNAAALGLRGWVRNCSDGAVEALFIGAADDIAAMVRRCAKGPPAARVDLVEETPAADDGSAGFKQLPTF